MVVRVHQALPRPGRRQHHTQPRRLHHRRRHHHRRACTARMAKRQYVGSAYRPGTPVGAPRTCTTARCIVRLTKGRLAGASARTTTLVPSNAARMELGHCEPQSTRAAIIMLGLRSEETPPTRVQLEERARPTLCTRIRSNVVESFIRRCASIRYCLLESCA